MSLEGQLVQEALKGEKLAPLCKSCGHRPLNEKQLSKVIEKWYTEIFKPQQQQDWLTSAIMWVAQNQPQPKGA